MKRKSRVCVTLSESGKVILDTVNRFGEHHSLELDDRQAERLLYDLHSIVTTKRGHRLPSNRIRRLLRI